jgi:hypothetical protein
MCYSVFDGRRFGTFARFSMMMGKQINGANSETVKKRRQDEVHPDQIKLQPRSRRNTTLE